MVRKYGSGFLDEIKFHGSGLLKVVFHLAGVLDLVNPELQVMAFIQFHSKELLRMGQVSKELVCRFKEKFYDSRQFLP